jgi:Fur family ferric uptake transcriptional regulator
MIRELEIFKDYLRAARLRMTAQRKTVLQTFLKIKGHAEMETVCAAVREADAAIGVATVYRTMSLLAACGLARVHAKTGGKRVFERLYRMAHHDHLVCTRCAEVVEFEHPMIEKLQMQMAARFDFIMQSHRLEIYGICRECKKAKP